MSVVRIVHEKPITGLRLCVRASVLALAAAVLGAAAWVLLHGGFGSGDVAAFAIWSIPFAGVVGTAALATTASRHPSARAFRLAMAAAAGVLLGILWTYFIAWGMGLWFGAMSFPIIQILPFSGALTLVGAELLWSRRDRGQV